MSSELVTGASGFLGAHVVDQLLAKGYRVRAAARAAKVGLLKQNYAKHGDNFSVVIISDIAVDVFPEALKGVDAVIHTAAPIPDKAEPEVILKGAEEGTINVIRQAQKAGIKKLVITSSIVSVMNSKNSFTDKDWYAVERAEALTGGKMVAYRAAKTLAERAVWEFADMHRDLDITTLNPPFLYGPFAPGFSIPEPKYGALSTNLYILRLLDPNGSFPISSSYIDVRDVARAHVAALRAPSESSVGRKRILLASPHENKFENVVQLISEKRPELKARLVTQTPPQYPLYKLPLDFKRVEDVIGISLDSYVSWENTFLDTVDSLLEVEKSWEAQGYALEIPKA